MEENMIRILLFISTGLMLLLSCATNTPAENKTATAKTSVERKTASDDGSDAIFEKFPIIGEVKTAPNKNQLALIKQVNNFSPDAKLKKEEMKWATDSNWKLAHTDICFDTAVSTMEINYCSDRKMQHLNGTLLAEFQQWKRDVRSNKRFRDSKNEILLTKFLQNAAIAKSKIVDDLCEAGSMSWWGGSARSAALMGCHSVFLKDMSEFEVLAAIAKYVEPTPPLNEQSDEYYAPTKADSVIAKKIMLVKNDASGQISSTDLAFADKCLNDEYKAVIEHYKTSYGTVEEVLTSAMNALKAQEKAWITYRDAYCQAYSFFLLPQVEDHMQYGAAARVECLTDLTYKQVNVLKTLDRDDE